MNEFSAPGWGVYVGIVTIVSILACGYLLLRLGQRYRPAAGETTGHVWDHDLVELNNPLPRWWVYLFFITIVFALIYLALYPGLGFYRGVFGWSSGGAYESESEALAKQTQPLFAAYLKQSPEELANMPQAMASAERIFLNNCAQCHGSDARGAKSYPNLTDSDWLYGGSADAIKQTIRDGRNGIMPAQGESLGSEQAIENLAQYVLSLSGSQTDKVKAELGKANFVVCAACHGPRGQGNQSIGAPNLTDRVWLYGGSLNDVMQTIRNGRSGTMPAHKDRLDEAQIHLLSAYLLGKQSK